MKDYLKVYKATLHTLSPVFVGSGKEINKKEYRLVVPDQKVIVYDPGKLYTALKKIGKVKLYEDFLLNDPKSNLNYWMRENGVYPQDISTAIRYKIDWGDRMELGKSKTSILEFTKDPYGLPYIPGTSIKGMLRSILIGYEISNNKDKFNKSANDIKSFNRDRPRSTYYKHEADSVEQTAFRKLYRNEEHPRDAVNDVLQGLIISDSKPLSIDDLVLCQKIDCHRDGQEKSLNILRECLYPGTDIEFTITIDTQRCCYDVETLMKAISEFNSVYHKVFTSKFGEAKNADDTVYLGGGVGFASKTFIYQMFGETEGIKTTVNVMKNTMNEKTFRMHKHSKDEQYGISPHVLKCTHYNGELYQMGKCKLMLQEIH